MKDGILIINKPAGITSHDVVMRLRRKFNMRRIGHAGTLDPLATGVLIMLMGEGTKLFNEFVGHDKAYKATFILGTQTKTADTQGAIIKQLPFEHITQNHIEDIFKKYKKITTQIPPMVSAVKVKGERLYALARKGIEVERAAREIRIDALNLISFRSPEVSFYLECSKGTYVRQLAEDIGNDLGCGACISQIERVKVGGLTIEEAVTLEDADESHIRHWPSKRKF